ncbi:MAG TPA: archaetidylserine decarboxylase, partial [Enhygromyxa sp.]|nr:archaetidylserine decarboxylase [Enhygromyxa sp.]
MAVQAYTRWFGVDLEDVDPELLEGGFPSFDAFFTRTLRDGARVVDMSPDILVAPSDGRLREVAEVEAQGVVVAKGHAYAIGELLGDAELAQRFVGGLQLVIYLHPRDYHRVHTPVSGVARRITAIPGRLLPVNDAAVAREPRLFAVNERLAERDARVGSEALDHLEAGLGEQHDRAAEVEDAELVALGEERRRLEIEDRLALRVRRHLVEGTAHVPHPEGRDHDHADDPKVGVEREHQPLIDREQSRLPRDRSVVDRQQATGDRRDA